MIYAQNVINQILVINGVINVMPNGFNKIFQIGLAKINILTILFKNLNAKNEREVLEWIPYNRLTNIKYLAKGGFSTVYNAIWLDGGYIWHWDNGKKQWKRWSNDEVVIKSLNNSSNINEEFLNEVSYYTKFYVSNLLVIS